jgi:hypothetical protein
MHSRARTSTEIDNNPSDIARLVLLFFLRKSRSEVLEKVRRFFGLPEILNRRHRKKTKISPLKKTWLPLFPSVEKKFAPQPGSAARLQPLIPHSSPRLKKSCVAKSALRQFNFEPDRGVAACLVSLLAPV